MLPNFGEISEIIEMIELLKIQNEYLLQIHSVLNFISLQFNILLGIICLGFVLKIIRFLFIEFERGF